MACEVKASSSKSSIVRFSMKKSASYDTEIIGSESNVNLISSEYPVGSDNIFDSSTPQLEFPIHKPRKPKKRIKDNASEENSQTGRRQIRMKIMLLLLAVTIIVATVLVWHFYHSDSVFNISDGYRTVARVDIKAKTLVVMDKQNKPVISILLDSKGALSNDFPRMQKCSSSKDKVCLNSILSNSSLRISSARFGDSDDITKMHCVKVAWTTHGTHSPSDCVDLSGKPPSSKPSSTIWFGTDKYVLSYRNSSLKPQEVCEAKTQCRPYIPGGSSYSTPFEKVLLHRGGAVIEPTWFSSDGAVVKASTHHNLNVCTTRCNDDDLDSKLCLSPLLDKLHQEQHHSDDEFHLNYMACVGDDLLAAQRETTEYFLKPDPKHKNVPQPFEDMVNDGAYFEGNLEKKILSKPDAQSPHFVSLVEHCSSLIEKPLWNFVFRDDLVNVLDVQKHLGFFRNVTGTVQISNVTQIFAKLGDFQLHRGRDYSAIDFVTALHGMGFSVMFPITPFVNYDAENFGFAARNRYLVLNEDGVPTLTSVVFEKEEFAGIVDLTNTNASHWYVENIRNFMSQNEVDYVHLYYGQAAWLPHSPYRLAEPLHNIGHFSTLFTDVASKVGRCSITDVAYDSQSRHQFVLLSPSMTMRGTLSAALAAGIAGYPFFVPSFPSTLQEAAKHMERGALTDGIMRWIEMVAFFPVMHIPWDYVTIVDQRIDIDSLTSITEKYVSIRNSAKVGPFIKKAMLEAEINSSMPVVAPMWMSPNSLAIDAERERILLIEDQFMIGANLFVAPIMDIGKRCRSVYIPPGKWTDIVQNWDLETKTGKWMHNYCANVTDIPVFTRTDGTLQ